MVNSQSPSGGSPGPREPALTLQRGGEELLLEKVVDRFTTQLAIPGADTAAQQAALDQLQALLQPQGHRAVARGQLVAWQVPAHRLETALQQARQSPDVAFASHVYRLVRSPQTWLYLSDQITIQFLPHMGRPEINAITTPLGLDSVQPLEGIPNTFVFRVTERAMANPIKLANQLIALPSVLTAEPNVVVETGGLYCPQDEYYNQQWHLSHSGGPNLAAGSHIDVERAWDMTRGSRSVVIAVSDDGFDLDHPDLQGMGKLVAPTDLQDKDALPLPLKTDENHGTAVAGLAIAEENGSGVVGVAPGCGFMPIRNTGFVDDESIEQIFSAAAKSGAAVISCSWSPASVYFPLTLRQSHAINKAATQGRNGKGCVILFSAGNANRPISGVVNEQGWPNQALKGSTEWLSGFAVHPDVIAVSASTSLSHKAAYSNWGDAIAIAAPSNNGAPNMALPEQGAVSTGPPLNNYPLPGLGMVTSDRTQAAGYSSGSYTNTFGGTSSSCPVAAGVAGLMLSVNPQLTAKEVRQILQTTADKVVDPEADPQLGLRYGTYDQNGHSRWFGYGKVNAFKAVQAAKQRAYPNRALKQVLKGDNTSPVAIPDAHPQGVTSPIAIKDSGQVQDLQVTVEVSHEFLGDLTLTLISPSQIAVLLQGRTLGGQTELKTQYTLSTTPMLAILIGQSATGNWLLQAIDHAPAATGRIRRWELVLGCS